MSDNERRPITQADCVEYNRHMPAHLQAELSELEWQWVELHTYPIAQRKPPQLKICDRNYSLKYYNNIMAMMKDDLSINKGGSSGQSERVVDPNARYDENGYRITSDAERDAYLNYVGSNGCKDQGSD